MLKGGNTYQCEVLAPVNGWFGEAGQNNTPYIRIPLVVTEGAAEGDEITHQAWLSDNAAEKTIKRLREVFDWDGDLVKLARQTDSGPFVGKKCEIETEEEEYNGKIRVKVKWLNRSGSGAKMIEPDRATALAERLMAKASQPKPKFADPDLDETAQGDIPF